MSIYRFTVQVILNIKHKRFKQCKHGNVWKRQCGVATMVGHSM